MLNTKVKHHWATTVLEWETAWDLLVLLAWVDNYATKTQVESYELGLLHWWVLGVGIR